MSSPIKRIPGWINNLDFYNPGTPIAVLSKKLGLNEEKIVKLASNENSFGCSTKVSECINTNLSDLHRYPDGNCSELKDELCKFYEINPNQIIVGNGSNDVLDCVARTFLYKGVSSVYSQHSFAVYNLATVSTGAESVIIPTENDLGHDLKGFLAGIKTNTNVIFIANPNNPTGTFIGENKIRQFLESINSSILVVLDEAYHEYLDDTLKINSINLLKDFPNLFITRSFSKAYGLASLRVGYGIGNEEVIDYINRVRQPFNVNFLAQKAAISALNDQNFVEVCRKKNNEIMSDMINSLISFGIVCVPSKANFVLANLKNISEPNCSSSGTNFFKILLNFGVITRPVENYDLNDWLRISVGNEKENNMFLNILPQAIEIMDKQSKRSEFL